MKTVHDMTQEEKTPALLDHWIGIAYQIELKRYGFALEFANELQSLLPRLDVLTIVLRSIGQQIAKDDEEGYYNL